MSDRQSDTELKYINLPHINAAKKEIRKAGQPWWGDGLYNCSDKYFRGPGAERDRLIETIRQKSFRFRGITTIIPKYLETGEYHVDDKGVGGVETYTQTLDEIVWQSAFCLKDVGKPTDEEDIFSILKETQEVVVNFQQQLSDVLKTEDTKNGTKMVSSLNKFRAIIQGRNQPVADLKDKYGSAYILFSELSDWVWFRNPYNIGDTVKHKVNSLNEEENDKYHLKQRKKLVAAINSVRRFSQATADHFDPTTVMQLLQDHEYIQVNSYDLEKYPDLIEPLKRYKQQKLEIVSQIVGYYVENPKDLCNINFASQKYVLDKGIDLNPELIQLFIENCSVEQLVEFLSRNLDSHEPLNLAAKIFDSGSTSVSDEKKAAVQKITFDHFREITNKSYTHNQAVYLLEVANILFLMEIDPNSIRQHIHDLTESMPIDIQFMIAHEAQMNLFLWLLNTIFIETLSTNFVDAGDVGKLIAFLDKRDRRYKDIDEKFSQLQKKLKRKFN